MNMSRIIGDIQKAIYKHSPEILTGIGIAGMITTTIMAVRATPKAVDLIDREIYRRNENTNSPIFNLEPVEVVKVAWKCYIPSAIVGSMSILCLVGGSSANVRRNAAIATAYTLSESALRNYQEKVIETIGEKKEQEVRDAVAKSKINRDPVSNREIIITDRGNTLCYDAMSGRYFKSDREVIKKAENELNRQMLSDTYVSLNEFYDLIGLNRITIGDDLGWYVNDGYLKLQFSSHLANDGTPCLVIDYIVAPRYDYMHR